MGNKNASGHQRDYQQLGIYIEKIENASLPAYRAARMQVDAYAFLFVIAGEMRISQGEETYSVPNGHGILLFAGDYIPVAEDTGRTVSGSRSALTGNLFRICFHICRWSHSCSFPSVQHL